MPLKFWCAMHLSLCDFTRHEEKVESWATSVPVGFFECAPTEGKNARVSMICRSCADHLRHPYQILLPDGTYARAVHTRSRHIRDTRGRRIDGLLALDPVPADTALPYPGLQVSLWQVEALKAELKIDFSFAYAKSGVKGRGMKMVILGQFTPKDERLLCGHLINCVTKTKLRANATWGHTRVDEAFMRLYPYLAKQTKLDELYPVIRVSKLVASRRAAKSL